MSTTNKHPVMTSLLTTNPRDDVKHVVCCRRLQRYNSVESRCFSIPDTPDYRVQHTRCV